MKTTRLVLCLTITLLCTLAMAQVSRAQDVILSKTLTSGPDPVGIGKYLPSEFVYTIDLSGVFDTAMDVFDVVPAEFDVTALAATCGTADSMERNLTKKGMFFRNPFKMSPDFIIWDLEGCETAVAQSLTVTIRTDNNPGHARRFLPFYEPTSCGPLYLNDGARLPAAEEGGTDIVSNPLSVAACMNEADAEGCVDTDDDGWSVDCGDCADADSLVNPGAVDICDGIDNDCDGEVDEGVPEICDDGIDNDCDALIDAEDDDCTITAAE